MREITRIHIAKVAYDIEVDAKVDVEEYIRALESYADDPEILDDIEIRITELLAEHGVAAGGVINISDVAAVRAKLGEPSDFALEGEVNNVISHNKASDEPRRVYRDENEGLVGGVLAGFAKFFGIDPLWVRLLFVLLLFASFGTALVGYLILWIIIPPAETAAEKLRMSGRPVTLESIKELVRRENNQDDKHRIARRILSIMAGILLMLVAIGGLFAIVAVVAGIGWTGYPLLGADFTGESWWFAPMMGLFVLSGLMFAALFFVLASAAFQRRWSKRVSTAVISIIAAGMVVFASGVGLGIYGYVAEQQLMADLSESRRIELTADIKSVRNLKIETASEAAAVGQIEYIVSSNPRIEVAGLPGIKPVISVSDEGETMTLELAQSDKQRRHFWNYYMSPTFKIYGPALESIEIDDMGQSVNYYNNKPQDKLSIVVEAGSFRLAGTYIDVVVTSKDAADITLGDATIEQLEVDLVGGSVSAGVVRALSVSQSEICPARDHYDVNGSLQVQAVSSGKMLYNNKEQAALSQRTVCGEIIIGDDDFWEELGEI